jgi:hypothetical protein
METPDESHISGVFPFVRIAWRQLYVRLDKEENMVKYYQFVPEDSPDEVLELTIQHVREHLSAVADEDDDPNTHADAVVITTEPYTRESDGRNGTIIRGVLDADPIAPYLRPDFKPEDDIAANPLTVKSILDKEDDNERSESE